MVSVTGKKIRRKTFAAREDLVDHLSRIAKEKGLTLYSYVNHLFELAVRAESENVNLSNLIEERELICNAKRAGFASIPERLWNDMIEVACDRDEEEAIGCWYETGVWFAKRYMSSDVSDPILALKEDLDRFAWSSPKVDIIRSEDELSINASSSRMSHNRTILYEAFWEGILEAFGFEIVEKDITLGNIYLGAIKDERYGGE